MRGSKSLINILSIACISSIILMEALLLYFQRQHLSYTPLGLTILVISLMGSSLAITSLLTIRLVICEQHPHVTQKLDRIRYIFNPSYSSIRFALTHRKNLLIGFIVASFYSLVYIWAEGLLVEASLGPVFFVIAQGPPGYAPMFVWFPVEGIGITVPLYQLFVIASLCLLVGLNTALALSIVKMGSLPKKALGASLAGATTGLLVACPVCVTPPLITILAVYISPWMALFLGVTRDLIGVALTYVVSIVLLWLGLSYSSRKLHDALECRVAVE